MTALVDEFAALLAPPVERRETHGAWVLLSGDRAYKLRKPVRLPYLDYSDVTRRLRCAQAEVALNAELAPGIYLGVQTLRRDDGVLTLGPWRPTPDAVDHVVVMRRYDEASTMAARVAAGTLQEVDVDAAAALIASFHARAAAAVGEVQRVAARVLDDLGDLSGLQPDDVEDVALRRYAIAALGRHAHEIDARGRAGLWRDGHGDLRAEHVVLGDPIRIVDRVEFDPDLRRIDVASDLAFLAMDLEALGARWAARRIVEAYAAAGGSPAGSGLQAFLAWQRAIVRLKIARLRGDVGAATRLHALADTLAWRDRISPVLLICGPPASGKSSLADALAERTGLQTVSTDRVRKDLHGVEATQRLPVEAYDTETTLRVYREVGRRAARAVAREGGVLVDATASGADERAALQVGLGGCGPVRALVCATDAQTLARRARRRLAQSGGVSDAGPDVALALAAGFDAPTAGQDGIAVVAPLDTTAAGAVARAARALDEA